MLLICYLLSESKNLTTEIQTVAFEFFLLHLLFSSVLSPTQHSWIKLFLGTGWCIGRVSSFDLFVFHSPSMRGSPGSIPGGGIKFVTVIECNGAHSASAS
uniref:Uncharacterized protein n=1 Tax=Cacopsylla melanoneura TaxID=428564 RepID=A0A8D8QVN1_9HEMI